MTIFNTLKTYDYALKDAGERVSGVLTRCFLEDGAQRWRVYSALSNFQNESEVCGAVYFLMSKVAEIKAMKPASADSEPLKFYGLLLYFYFLKHDKYPKLAAWICAEIFLCQPEDDITDSIPADLKAAHERILTQVSDVESLNELKEPLNALIYWKWDAASRSSTKLNFPHVFIRLQVLQLQNLLNRAPVFFDAKAMLKRFCDVVNIRQALKIGVQGNTCNEETFQSYNQESLYTDLEMASCFMQLIGLLKESSDVTTLMTLYASFLSTCVLDGSRNTFKGAGEAYAKLIDDALVLFLANKARYLHENFTTYALDSLLYVLNNITRQDVFYRKQNQSMRLRPLEVYCAVFIYPGVPYLTKEKINTALEMINPNTGRFQEPCTISVLSAEGEPVDYLFDSAAESKKLIEREDRIQAQAAFSTVREKLIAENGLLHTVAKKALSELWKAKVIDFSADEIVALSRLAFYNAHAHFYLIHNSNPPVAHNAKACQEFQQAAMLLEKLSTELSCFDFLLDSGQKVTLEHIKTLVAFSGCFVDYPIRRLDKTTGRFAVLRNNPDSLSQACAQYVKERLETENSFAHKAAGFGSRMRATFSFAPAAADPASASSGAEVGEPAPADETPTDTDSPSPKRGSTEADGAGEADHGQALMDLLQKPPVLPSVPDMPAPVPFVSNVPEVQSPAGAPGGFESDAGLDLLSGSTGPMLDAMGGGAASPPAQVPSYPSQLSPSAPPAEAAPAASAPDFQDSLLGDVGRQLQQDEGGNFQQALLMKMVAAELSRDQDGAFRKDLLQTLFSHKPPVEGVVQGVEVKPADEPDAAFSL
jgi:hypothetical protein